jgi:hypothetical protein
MGKRGVEGVATNDLVEMWRWDEGWVDERIDAVDYELRALESQHGRDGEVIGWFGLSRGMVDEEGEGPGQKLETHGRREGALLCGTVKQRREDGWDG